MSIIGKVLLLALVSVAATEVAEDDLKTIIENAVKEIRSIQERTASTLNSALDVYYVNDQAILDTVTEQLRMLETLKDKDIETITASAQKLVQIAIQAHAKEHVFTCIEDRSEKTIEDLNNTVANFDKIISQVGDFKREEQFKLAYGLFKIRASLFFHDNLFNTTEEIKACKTEECVEEIVDRYTRENNAINTQIKVITVKLTPNVEKSKRDIRSLLITAKRDVNKVKGTGMNAMRACLIKKE